MINLKQTNKPGRLIIEELPDADNADMPLSYVGKTLIIEPTEARSLTFDPDLWDGKLCNIQNDTTFDVSIVASSGSVLPTAAKVNSEYGMISVFGYNGNIRVIGKIS